MKGLKVAHAKTDFGRLEAIAKSLPNGAIAFQRRVVPTGADDSGWATFRAGLNVAYVVWDASVPSNSDGASRMACEDLARLLAELNRNTVEKGHR